MLEIVIIIWVMYLIYIWEWILKNQRTTITKLLDSHEKSNSSIDILLELERINSHYDKTYYIESLLKSRKRYNEIEEILNKSDEELEKDTFIKKMEQTKFYNLIREMNLILFQIYDDIQFLEFLKDLENQTKSEKISQTEWEEKIKKFREKKKPYFDINNETNWEDFSNNVRQSLWKYSALIEYKNFNLEKLEYDLLNKNNYKSILLSPVYIQQIPEK